MPVATRRWPGRFLGRLLRSATLQQSGLYGAMGAMFMLANLLLARILPVADYATVSLVLAVTGFGGLIGPLGQERAVVRRNIATSLRLACAGLACASATGLGIAATAGWLYDLERITVFVVLAGAIGHAMAVLAAARFQSERRFILATLVSQSPAPLLLTAAVILAVAGQASSGMVSAAFAAGLVAVAAAGWRRLLAEAGPAPRYQVDWPETLALSGISAMAALSATLERLIVPLLLSPEALATFAVLAALVIAPMRMLQMAVQRTLTPRLRDAASPEARRRLLLRESLMAGGLAGTLGLGLWFAAPVAVPMLLGGKYGFTPSLVLAAIASGAVRVLTGIAMAAVTALCPRERLHLVNGSGWLALSLALPASWIGTGWGLTGLVLGVAAASLCQAAVLLLLIRSSLRSAPIPTADGVLPEVRPPGRAGWCRSFPARKAWSDTSR